MGKTITMNIAELVVTTEPVVISTVLGSCISVCLFSKGAGKGTSAGGMNHYALPTLTKESPDDNPLRYGDHAIKTLIEELTKLTGLSPSSFVAKIIGGSHSIASEQSPQLVGDANVKVARKILSDFNIKIIGEDVGGSMGRKVLFHIQTGRLQSAPINQTLSYPSVVKGTAASTTAAALRGTKDTKPSTSALLSTPAEQNKVITKKKVLIVDDSKTIRDLLCKIIEQDPQLEVIGQAEDPIKAERLLHQLKPDVITLDVHMPKMTGVQWLETLLPKRAIPVIMITSLELKDGNEVFRALELGAVDYIQKPTLNEVGAVSQIIREKIHSASVAKVRVRSQKNSALNANRIDAHFEPNIILAIGASTGGTEAIKEVLIRLPANIPPTVIVQHIPPVFSKAFSDRLNSLCPFEVKEAENGDELCVNRVLVAPGGAQMKVLRKKSGALFVEVNDDPPMNRHKPSVDYLFHSVAEVIGKKAIGVILTGMGADGAKGLLHMKEKGARTLSQDEDSSVVYGMPKAAWEIGASLVQVELEKVAAKIVELGKSKKAA